jgi:TctA family transporter
MYLSDLARDLGVELHKFIRGSTHEHSKFRDRVVTTVLVTLAVDAIGSTLMYVFEHGKKNSDIGSVFQGIFWVTTQLLTVSSQMKNPVTTGGRIVDMFLELWAITVVATVAGSFAAFLQKK